MKKIIIISLLVCSQLFSQESNFELFAVSDLVKIFEDGYNLPDKQNEINVFGIKGEVISAQFVIHSSVKVEDVKILIGDLVNSGNDDVVSSDFIQYNFVKSVPVTVNSEKSQNKSVVRKAPALFPDYLAEEKETEIGGGIYQSVWVTIEVPYEVSAANYSGNIKVKTSIGNNSIPIKLEVYPFKMPEKSNLNTAIWFALDNKYHDFDEKISVSSNGCFRKAISLSPENNIVNITAVNGDSQKEIIREYKIIYP